MYEYLTEQYDDPLLQLHVREYGIKPTKPRAGAQYCDIYIDVPEEESRRLVVIAKFSGLQTEVVGHLGTGELLYTDIYNIDGGRALPF